MRKLRALIVLLPALVVSFGPAAKASAQTTGHDQTAADLWELAKSKAQTHRFSTLMTAQDVRDRLSTEDGITAAIDWCRKTGVTKVYVECFRDGYQAKRESLRHAKQRFKTAGFEVSGCVTTTNVGKRSSGSSGIACYTDMATQEPVLRQNIPELLAVAEEIRHRSIVGVAAYKPANSLPENERRVFDFVGMLGLPLAPCHEFPAEAKTAFFSIHALKDPNLTGKLAAFIAAGKQVLITENGQQDHQAPKK